jgi:hypothetical protein
MKFISNEDKLRIAFFRQYPWSSEDEFNRYEETFEYKLELLILEVKSLVEPFLIKCLNILKKILEKNNE